MAKAGWVGLNTFTYMTKSDEARAAAEAAIGARQKATEAKTAADAAPGNQDLADALVAAEKAATEAASQAFALSQALPSQDDIDRKREKLLRKRKFIDKDLHDLGVDVDDEDEDDDEEDLDKPLTLRHLQAIEAGNARKTAQEMADAITDPLDKEAVTKALMLVVPTRDSAKDFQAAVAIANIDRNSKILEEIQRRPITRSSPTGTGAPARREETFIPTADEQMFMKQMGLKKEDILKARAKAQENK